MVDLPLGEGQLVAWDGRPSLSFCNFWACFVACCFVCVKMCPLGVISGYRRWEGRGEEPFFPLSFVLSVTNCSL